MTGPGDKGQPGSGWDAQWLDNVGRPWLIDFKTQFGDPRFELVQRWVHTKALDVFADLSWEQIAELRHNMAAILEYYVPSTRTASGTYGWSGTATGETPPERLTATVEAASPKLAADLHEQKWNRTEFIAALTLLLMLIQTMFQIYEDWHPETPPQVTHIINIIKNDEQTVINLPPSPAGDGKGLPDAP